MLRLVLENAGLAFWPAVSLLIFFGSTLCVLAWIYRPGSADFYRRLGGLALEDQSGGTPVSASTRSTAPITPKTSSEI
jgi:cbb3-type cytochrome oxidase subunit 3